ncbi:MAG: hypothetical protein ACI4RD_02290 [Kiritimatiellia bacterium]
MKVWIGWSVGVAAAFAAMVGAAAEASGWKTVFTDDFTTHMTFAECWRPEKAAPVRSAGGCCHFAGAATMARNAETPDAFRASATFAVKTGRAGIRCGGNEVAVGAGETKRITLDCSQGGCGTSRLIVFAEGEATMDDFAVEVPAAADESPNLVPNASFEHVGSEFPLYVARNNNYDYEKWREYPFDEFLGLMGSDTNVVHSGRRSLRISAAPLARGPGATIKNVATKKGASGVFSLWLKADRPGLKFKFGYGSVRTVEVATEWTRYETVCTNLPGARSYLSPLSFRLSPEHAEGTVWVDDLQAEFLDPAPTAEELASGKTFATPFRPCAQDRSRFTKPVDVRAPGFAVKKLPAGLKPTVELDGWKDAAAATDRFWVNDRRPSHRTEAYFAVDEETLYVGVRCFGEKFVPRGDKPQLHDNFGIFGVRSTSCELLLDPDADGRHWQFAFNDLGYVDIGANRNVAWTGDWTHESRANEQAGATDYFFAIPLRHFASSGLQDGWPMVVGRNDGAACECVTMHNSPLGGFHRKQCWPILELPKDVVAKYRLAKQAVTGAAEPRVVGRLDYYMNEPEAKFRIFWPDGRLEERSVDIRALPCGTNAVTVAGLPAEVVKRPYRRGATQVNHFTRSLMHDGRPMFHAAPFLGDLHFSRHFTESGVRARADFYRHHGFKYQHVLIPQNTDRNFPQSFANGEAYLRRTAENGQIVLLWTGFEEFKPGAAPAEVARVIATNRHFAAEFQRWNHISSVIVADEPELSRPSDVVRDLLLRLKPYFPYHPVQMNNTTMGIPNNYAGLKTDVLMLDDYLTNSEGRDVAGIVRQADIMWEAGEKEAKPCYYFLVGGNFPLHYKEPSYEEQIAQSWGCICSGVTGISWFYGSPVTPGNWKAMCEVAKETGELEELLLSEELVAEARPSVGRTELRTITRRRGDELLVATCNIADRTLAAVTFTLPEPLPQDGTVEVLYEHRTLKLKGGTFGDGYAPHSRHLYRIKRATP